MTNFLVKEYGVPEPLAAELIQWAGEQEVRVHPSWADEFHDREMAYQRARKLIRRVRDLGYKRPE